jgi:hypothetical protein
VDPTGKAGFPGGMNINRRCLQVDAEPAMPLLRVLRELRT